MGIVSSLGISKLCSKIKLWGMGGWLATGRAFLKTDFVVKYKGLFVCLNFGNSAVEMCVSERLC